MPIREIATLRRRFMPPLYFPTSLSATPPASKRTLLKDCSIDCKNQKQVVSVSFLVQYYNLVLQPDKVNADKIFLSLPGIMSASETKMNWLFQFHDLLRYVLRY